MSSRPENRLKFRSTWERYEATTLLREAIDRMLPDRRVSMDRTIARRLAETSGPLEERLADNLREIEEAKGCDAQMESLRKRLEDDIDKAEREIRFEETDRKHKNQASFERMLDQLATCTQAAYEHSRVEAAEKLSVLVQVLDRETQQLRGRLPGGAPLKQRARLPDVLDAKEIVDLWTDDEQAREGLMRMILRAERDRKIRTCGQALVTEPLDTSYVAKVLQKHIGDISRELHAKIDRNICFLRRALLKKFNSDLTDFREEIRDAVSNEIAALRAELQSRPVPEAFRRNGGIDRLRRNRLWSDAEREPLLGTLGVSYGFGGDRTIPLIHRDEFRRWLETEDEWPVAKRRHLGRWWLFPSGTGVGKTASERRAAVLDQVVFKLIAEHSESTDRWYLETTKRELFALCQIEAPHLFQSRGTFEKWWQEDIRKEICRTPHDY